MNTRKKQSELIFIFIFLYSLKYFFFFCQSLTWRIQVLVNPAEQNRLCLKTYTGSREKELSKIVFNNRF